MTLPEDILHFIWKFRLYEGRQLCTVGGETLVVMETGLISNRHGYVLAKRNG